MNPEFALKALQLATKRESTSFGELLSAFGKKRSDEFGFRDWSEIVIALSEIGLGLAPHCMLFREFPATDSPVFFYQSTDVHLIPTKDEQPVFQMGILVLTIGSFILSAAGWDHRSIEEKILETVKTVENPKTKFSESDYAGFRSNIDYLVRKPIDEKFMRFLMEICTELGLEMTQGTALLFLQSLDENDPKLESIAIKAIEIFDLIEFLKSFDEFVESGTV